jgi:hypothetical protein
MASTQISGFYQASKTVANVITFYVQTPMPSGIEYGWTLTGLSGIQGQTRIVATTLQQGNAPQSGGYNGTIDFQVNIPQTIQGAQQAGAVTVAPTQIIAPPPPPTLSGAYYTQMGLVVFYSSVPLPSAVVPGWTISGLPGMPFSLNVSTVSFQSGVIGRVSYKGILTATPIPPQPLSTPPDPSALQKLMSVLRQIGAFAGVLSGRLIGLDTYVFRDPGKLSNYLSRTPNLLNFFVNKTGLQPDSIISDPTQIKGVLSGLPEIRNALGFRMAEKPGTNTKMVDGFLNDEMMLLALGQGQVLAPSLPNTDAYPNGVPVNSQGGLFNPASSTAFVPAKVSTVQPVVRPPVEDSNFKILPNTMRDLDDNVPVPPLAPETLTEKRNLGFNAGGVLALEAYGPQEQYISNIHNFTESQWTPKFEQYTNSVLYQDYIKLTPISSNTFIQPTASGTCIVEIQPKNQGDLLANMFLQCTLPPLAGSSYTNQIGRAIIQQIDFIIDDVVVETIYDDWLFIKDQTFLDYDEQIGMFSQVNGGQPSGTTGISPTSPVPLTIPLEFFFCRRHSGANTGRERLRKPFFPLCALWDGQRVYIKFTFRPQYWFTNYTGTVDIQNPILLIEYVKITDSERIYYRHTPLRYIVPVVKRDATAQYKAGSVTTNISANFPVQLIAWFIRNQAYESTSSSYYAVRYLYGYAAQYQNSATPLNFSAAAQSTTVSYTDVIQTVKITVNNQDILDTFANGPYTSFLQPMQHGLSVPQKNIYMYSFGLNITEYNSGGYLNFSKINSQTSNLTITFLPQYTKALANYNLYLFYYGFAILEFKDGSAGVSYL